MWPNKRIELKTVVAGRREERYVWEPNVDSGPSWREKIEGMPGGPWDGLAPVVPVIIPRNRNLVWRNNHRTVHWRLVIK